MDRCKFFSAFARLALGVSALAVTATALCGRAGMLASLNMGLPGRLGGGADAAQLAAVLLPNFTGASGQPQFFSSSFWESFFEPRKVEPEPVNESAGAQEILASLSADEVFTPLEGDGLHAVIRTDMSPSDVTEYIMAGDVYIRNKSIQTLDTDSLMREKLELDLAARPDGPLVLIYHSHTTEAYNTTGDTYADPDVTHSADENCNVVAVGEVLAQTLNACGIETVHCTERMDSSYTGAYYRSDEAVARYLEEYPGIRVVLDLHRDAIYTSDGGKYRPVASAAAGDAAQMMIIVGTGDGGEDENEHWQDNLRFAVALQARLEAECEGLTRALTVRTSSFNQYRSKGALLIEMGTTGNTLTEAKRSACYLGMAIRDVIEENEGEGIGKN